MLELWPGKSKSRLTVLCLGAHCDDIEIGCGATIRKLIESGREVEFLWCVLSSNDRRRAEAASSAEAFLKGAADQNVLIKNFRNGYFPSEGAGLKEFFEKLKTRIDPDIIFTHFGNDRHQDHRTVSELTWNTFRRNWILEYEIPKYDGDMGAPNVFAAVEDEHAEFKISTILRCFESQSTKAWFERSTFAAIMRLRGMECCSKSGYAEAFYGRKNRIGF